MKEVILQILEYNRDINMTSSYARESLAEIINEEVKQHMDKMFMEEYELIMNPPTEPF
jgi:hypothetical protein